MAGSPRAGALFVTDGWSLLHETAETSLRLLAEAHAMGEGVAWAEVTSVRWAGEGTLVDACRVVSAPSHARAAIALAPPEPVPVSAYPRIFFRPDLVTRATRHALQLVCVELERQGLDAEDVVVNPPSVLLGKNEKLAPAALSDTMPASVVSARESDLVAFGERVGVAVLKPLHLHQSQGVQRLAFGGAQTVAAIEALRRATEGFVVPVVLQRFLPAFETREKRLWFVRGVLLAWARKSRPSSTFPLDMDHDGTLVRCELDAREQRAAAHVGAWLQSTRVALAGVDLVDGFVTDVNFVSPGLLVELERAVERNLARQVCEALLVSGRR